MANKTGMTRRFYVVRRNQYQNGVSWVYVLHAPYGAPRENLDTCSPKSLLLFTYPDIFRGWLHQESRVRHTCKVTWNLTHL